ncbi:MAG: UDP-N-acetylmuramate dehydrogenase [Tissierellia bacterium]|nr:UDP-N-acetylmuramate dehydrogenase [Tissierellia bacterium]
MLSIDEYKNIFKEAKIGEVLYMEPMKNHTTFRIGGPCDVMILPSTEEEIIAALKIIKDNNLDYMIIGNGSNLLVRDKGLRKVVIKLHDNFSNVEVDGLHVKAQAGALLSTVSKTAMKKGLTGMEALSGIPGDIGGAVTMNAGAYGTEIKDVVLFVKAIDKDLNIRIFNNEEMNFRYRNSKVQDDSLVVLETLFKLKKGDKEEIESLFKDVTYKRTSKQPLEYASAGSTFKRPTGYFAGKLIDDSGLRGYRYKDAQVSEKHCGFVINRGNANFEEVHTLIEHVQEVVYKNYGVKLETEVKIIGEE